MCCTHVQLYTLYLGLAVLYLLSALWALESLCADTNISVELIKTCSPVFTWARDTLIHFYFTFRSRKPICYIIYFS